VNTPALTQLLAEAEAAFDAADPLAAAQAVERAARLCAQLASSRTLPDGGAFPRLLEQHARLELRALQARDALASQLAQAGRSRRAVAAYRRR
jgi:hypothetical protein